MTVSQQHIVLQIVKGILQAPGDTYSAEQAMDMIDLLSAPDIALAIEGWSPKVASLKGGGVWADSNIAAGRRLLAAVDGNVTETMQVLLGNEDLSQRHAILRRLNRIIQDCRDFWQTEYQIDPVYLRWHSAVGAGEQYALIYNIELDYQIDSFMLDNPWNVTLTIEREPYWRGLPPGMNPKEWYLNEYSGRPRGAGYTLANMILYDDDDHLAVGQVENKHEWNPADYTNTIRNNFITIPAERIPGDAPALVQIDVDNGTVLGGYDILDVFIARWTKAVVSPTHRSLGTTRAPATMYAAADAALGGTGCTQQTTASNGVISFGSLSQEYYVSVDFTSNPSGIIWGGDDNAPPEISLFDMNMMRGTYAVFLRHSQVGGSQGDIDLQLDLYAEGSTNAITNSYRTLTGTALVSAGAQAATNWNYRYLGTLTLPPSANAYSGPAGYGLEMFSEDTAGQEHNFRLALTITRNTGTATFNALDLILLPMDESLIRLSKSVTPDSLTPTVNGHFLYDNTGYIRHGKPEAMAMEYGDDGYSTGVFSYNALEIRGSDLHLKPGVDNRLYFWLTMLPAVAQATESLVYQASPTIRLNIVPRWRGIRDV